MSRDGPRAGRVRPEAMPSQTETDGRRYVERIVEVPQIQQRPVEQVVHVEVPQIQTQARARFALRQ